MSECRSLTNFIGNAVATVVVARWEGAFDKAQFDAAIAGHLPSVGELPEGTVTAE
jgi:aerobic C4-dicarboxylate transport protein